MIVGKEIYIKISLKIQLNKIVLLSIKKISDKRESDLKIKVFRKNLNVLGMQCWDCHKNNIVTAVFFKINFMKQLILKYTNNVWMPTCV